MSHLYNKNVHFLSYLGQFIRAILNSSTNDKIVGKLVKKEKEKNSQ